MLTTAEIIKKVRELEIKSKKLTSDLFTGEYHSAFKGKGMSFKEVREYAAGDDIRFIDWNVSARFGHPYSKIFEEERELTVMLLVDISSSSLFGTQFARKKDIQRPGGSIYSSEERKTTCIIYCKGIAEQRTKRERNCCKLGTSVF